jgi:hypothetical protein
LAASALPEDDEQVLQVFRIYFGFFGILEFNKSLKVSYLKSFESAFMVFLKDFDKFKSLYFKVIIQSNFISHNIYLFILHNKNVKRNLTIVLKKIKNNIKEFYRIKAFEITNRADASKVVSPFSIFRPYLGSLHLSASSRQRRTSSSFSKNFLSLIDFQNIAEKIFTQKEIEEFLLNLEDLGFDFVRNQNSLGVVIQNKNLYTSEFILGN